MKRSLITTGLGLLLAAVAPACGGQEEGLALPGDVDDSPEGGGKGDEWNGENDPANLSTHLQYKLDLLPKSGKIDKPVWSKRFEPKADDPVMWSDTYWPTAEGSTNVRWLGADTRSPLEKYDQAFNNAAGCATQPAKRCGPTAKAEWATYMTCAGPAAKWHATNFHGSQQMYDGVDSDGDGKVDECEGDNDGIEGWWGLCHAWAPSSVLEPEPRHAATHNGVEFTIGDIKALIHTIYDANDSLMLGGRCHAKTIERDDKGRVVDADCGDTNAGAWHVVVTNFIGIGDAALVMDRTANFEVWNQPIHSYRVNMQRKVSKTRANECIGGATGRVYTYNPAAVTLYEVEMTAAYLVETGASEERLGLDGFLQEATYHYILELDSRGKVIGGEWCDESATDHPDFLWAPQGASQSSYGRNPHVDIDQVMKLLELSRQ